MIIKQHPQSLICESQALAELGKYAFSVLYRSNQREALLVRFKGVVYGYLNQCAHMPRRLDCEQQEVFDESGRYLQCSMHNICYDPVTGESLSEICLGKKLTGLKVREEEGRIYLVDKRAELIPPVSKPIPARDNAAEAPLSLASGVSSGQ